MPLCGIVCCQDGQRRDFSYCQEQSLKGACAFARPLIDEMAGKEASREGAGISTTTLQDCPRKFCLAKTEPYFESPADYHARWRGTGVHAMALSYGPYPGVIQERRIRLVVATESGEAELTGTPDWYNAETQYLEDWKSTKVVPNAPYDDHKAQVNIYAMLIEDGKYDALDPVLPPWKPRFKVKSAAIRYIDPDRSVAIPVDLWSEEYTRNYVRGKMEPLIKFQGTGELPEGIANDPESGWKSRFCIFRGTGKCCADAESKE